MPSPVPPLGRTPSKPLRRPTIVVTNAETTPAQAAPADLPAEAAAEAEAEQQQQQQQQQPETAEAPAVAEPEAAPAEAPAAAEAEAEATPAAAEAANDDAHVPGEDQFYSAPADHVTGEVDDLAKLTNLNPKTLLSEIQVGAGLARRAAARGCGRALAAPDRHTLHPCLRSATRATPSTRTCQTFSLPSTPSSRCPFTAPRR